MEPCGDRALIEDVWREKIRGCSYGGNRCVLLNIRCAPITTKFRSATKWRDGQQATEMKEAANLGGLKVCHEQRRDTRVRRLMSPAF